jgi:hypothetical protein
MAQSGHPGDVGGHEQRAPKQLSVLMRSTVFAKK